MKLFASAVLLLSLIACRPQPQATRQEEARPANPDTAAGKAGQAAHEVIKDADRGLKKVGKEIKEAARDAKAGWNDAKERDKARRREP